MNWQAKERSELASKRNYYSMRIYEALKRNGQTAATVACDLSISRTAVSATILGKNHSPRILDALRAVGVPEKYLFDPRRTERPVENNF